MPNTFSDSQADPMDTDSIPLLPSDLWSIPYFRMPGILAAATLVDPVRVGEIFSSSAPAPVVSAPTQSAVLQSATPALFRPSPPPITQYNGSSATLRSFCSQLTNQIQGSGIYFPDENAKVHFAYQCLGPGALEKMRSSFRCLEDPSVPVEIETLDQFIAALKQRCQDPSLRHQATSRIDGLRQNNLKFHDFITVFEDNMADSLYSNKDKSQWRDMLERRLSVPLRKLLLSASDVPSEYHKFVAYLRLKDAGLQEIKATSSYPEPYRPPMMSHLMSNSTAFPTATPTPRELTVSQGGSAMDLDIVSRQKGPDGKLTPAAKEARRTLGRCVWCNRSGHLVSNCPLGSRSIASITTTDQPTSEALKEPLQQ